MLTRLPKWVEYGAFILALIAGFINAVGLFGFHHQSISHLSGITTLIGVGLTSSHFTHTLHLIFIVMAFIVGAALSGFILRDGALKLGRNYSALLLIEGLLLATAVICLNQQMLVGHYLASAACGLQNAMVTTYSGAVIRTTHVTGVFTDLGLMLGAKLGGEAFDTRKALLFFLIVSGFLLGGTLGAFAYQDLAFNALYIPATLCLLLAAGYQWYGRRNAA